MSIQLRKSVIQQSFPTTFIVHIQAVARTYLLRKEVFSKHLSFRSSSPPSIYNLTKQARYARAEASLRLALLKSENEPSPLELQIRIMHKGLSAWNARVVLGQERVQKAEDAMIALRTGNLSPALSRVDLAELQKEKWMGIKERDEALDMVKKIKHLIEELNTELRSGSKRSSLTPASRPDVQTGEDETDEPQSPKVKLLFSGRFLPPYLERLPRTRHSVEPLRLPLKHEESRRRASSLSSPPRAAPSSPLSSSSASASLSSSDDDDTFGAVLIYTNVSDPFATTDKSESHFRLPGYVDTLLDELSADHIGLPKFDISNDVFRVMPSTPTSQRTMPRVLPSTPSPQKTMPSSYQTPTTPKAKHRGLLRHRLSNISISHFKDTREPSTPRSTTTATSVDTSESAPATPPATPRKKRITIENVMNSVKKGVKKVSKLVDS